MPLYDFIRSFFGFPNQRRENYEHSRDIFPFNPRHGPHVDDEANGDFSGPNFDMFTDPLQMHRYFEQQMNEMMRSFNGMFGTDDNVYGFGSFPSIGGAPPAPGNDAPKQNLRDHYLKPGYEPSRNQNVDPPKSDTDLDGKVDLGDLDGILRERPTPAAPHVRMFGQSITSRTMRRPDGSVETRRTVRSHDGSEEVTVTRQLGDQQHSVTTRTDRQGRREQVEDLTNVDERELAAFDEQWDRGGGRAPGGPDPDLFSRFFR